jgi:amidase
MGLTSQKLPAGVQIITRQYGDYTSIRFAELLEKEYCGFVPPPGYRAQPPLLQPSPRLRGG